MLVNTNLSMLVTTNLSMLVTTNLSMLVTTHMTMTDTKKPSSMAGLEYCVGWAYAATATGSTTCNPCR